MYKIVTVKYGGVWRGLTVEMPVASRREQMYGLTINYIVIILFNFCAYKKCVIVYFGLMV